MSKLQAVKFIRKASERLEKVNVSAVAIVIMANGQEYDQIKFSDDKSLELRRFLRPLLDCKSLNGKPKIVITQFCRGSRHVGGQFLESDDSDDSVTDQYRKLHNEVRIVVIM